MKQWGFLFNMDACIGCKACELACRNENQTPPTVRWRRVEALDNNTFLSIACNHCDSPECFRVCPEQAFTKRHDGIVLINSDLCNGCGICVSACPYHAPQYDPVQKKVSKCTMCVDRLERGLLPACVEACTTGSLALIPMDEEIPGTVPTVEGFPDIRLTNPSLRFYPPQPRRRYWIVEQENENEE